MAIHLPTERPWLRPVEGYGRATSRDQAVGGDGAVVGVDISSDLIELCKRRNPPTWLSYSLGDATQLAQPDVSFDAVVCTQVAEYIPHVSRVLSEAFRVLKEGGRAVFVATDWDALIWRSESPDRMTSVLKSWEWHCAHPRLPRSLVPRLVSAGFQFNELVVFPILNLQWAMRPIARACQASSGISSGGGAKFQPKT